jgi:hypothetical protein
MVGIRCFGVWAFGELRRGVRDNDRVLRLSPRQIQNIGTLICGDDEDSPTDYRR